MKKLISILLVVCSLFSITVSTEASSLYSNIVSSFTESIDPDSLIIPTVELPNFPYEIQAQNNYCGAACTRMAIKYLTGNYYSQEYLANILGITSNGSTDALTIKNTLNLYTSINHGRYSGNNNLFRSIITYSLNNNTPVIISGKQFPDYSVSLGHFVIITAYYFAGSGTTSMVDIQNKKSVNPLDIENLINDPDSLGTLKFRYYDPNFNYPGNKWVSDTQLYNIMNSFTDGPGNIIAKYNSSYNPY